MTAQLQTKHESNGSSQEVFDTPATHPKIEILREMVKAGVHFGHHTSRWSPRIAPYLHGAKGAVHLFNLEKTLEKLEVAENFVRDLAAGNKIILFVGTKPAARLAVREAALRCAMPYVHRRWLGGTLTNFRSLSERTRYFRDLEAKRSTGELAKYTKREQLLFSRQLADLEEKFGGIKNMTELPSALFIVDIVEEAIAIREAKRVGIPTVAIVDTNADPTLVTYPIPANDDAQSSVAFLINRVTSAIEAGRASKSAEVLPQT